MIDNEPKVGSPAVKHGPASITIPQAEYDRLRRDSRRFQYLKAHAQIVDRESAGNFRWYFTAPFLRGNTVDEAIDRALNL